MRCFSVPKFLSWEQVTLLNPELSAFTIPCYCFTLFYTLLPLEVVLKVFLAFRVLRDACGSKGSMWLPLSFCSSAAHRSLTRLLPSSSGRFIRVTSFCLLQYLRPRLKLLMLAAVNFPCSDSDRHCFVSLSVLSVSTQIKGPTW